MGILIKKVRISGFRGLKNIEVELEKTTVLTGVNNVGKTSFLKAIQIALGNRQFVTQDDFYIGENKIIIDVLIVPTDQHEQEIDDFSEDWELLFTVDKIKTDGTKSFIPFRTIVEFHKERNSYKTSQYSLQEWYEYEINGVKWSEQSNGSEKSFYFEEIPFFYMDAQRDILEDTKLKNSYIGKMLSRVEYSPEEIQELEEQIKLLNEKAIEKSDILSSIKTSLKELDSAIGNKNENVEITPFTKKVRDLNKGLTIYYSNGDESFPMEYHGMGTRSWSSLLTLKSFISLLINNATEQSKLVFPFVAIEEPEAHLHPQAQKKLYTQLKDIHGQKIISTHSPYIAASADLSEIRSFYKNEDVICKKMDLKVLSFEEKRKIERQVINTRGEIFFSKAVVFFEGETEEQALPIFAKKFFKKSHVELAIDFIGVGGFKSYTPFLRLANNFEIPWFILSDAEANVMSGRDSIPDQIRKANATGKVVFLNSGNDFEKQLIEDGYQDEIKKAILSLDIYNSTQHKQAVESKRILEITNKTDEELYGIMTGKKTKFAPAIANEIFKSTKKVPPKIEELFKHIENILNV